MNLFKTKKLIIFGQGLYTEIANQYFSDDSEYEVVAFTKDDNFIESKIYLDKPMIKFSEIQDLYPPNEYYMFIAVSYTEMNDLRKRKFFEAKEKGYKLISYISSKCSWMTKNNIGENSFVFEDNTIQPFVKIGNNVIIWSGNHIGHHSIVEDHNFISSHVVISGQCNIKPGCFIGVNSTIAHGVTIDEKCLIGAGSVITKNTEKDSVYVPQKSIKIDKKSFEFKL